MTFFYNKGVFFFSNLLGFNPSAKSSKQVGVISKAIRTLNKINEDIVVSVQKDKVRISKLRDAIESKNLVKYDNVDMIKKFDNILL
jgi:hypothetical protein